MSEDLTFRFPDSSFTLRAACIILFGERFLCAANQTGKAFYTISGRVRAGESTTEAALREAKEETGYPFEIERLLFVQERFFEENGKAHHHIVFYYLMKGPSELIRDGSSADMKGFETLHWLPLSALHGVPLAPPFLKTALQRLPETTRHFVSFE